MDSGDGCYEALTKVDTSTSNMPLNNQSSLDGLAADLKLDQLMIMMLMMVTKPMTCKFVSKKNNVYNML